MTSRPLHPLRTHGFDAALARAPGASVVMFSSATCGTCRRVEALLPGALPGDIAMFRVDAAEDAALVSRFDVFHLPALFLFRDGHFHARLHGDVPSLADEVSRALAADPEEEP